MVLKAASAPSLTWRVSTGREGVQIEAVNCCKSRNENLSGDAFAWV